MRTRRFAPVIADEAVPGLETAGLAVYTVPHAQNRNALVSQIDVHARHQMNRKDAQEAADKLATDLAEKFDIEYGWDGDDIHFERMGVHGTITVSENDIHIQAELGLLLGFLKPRVEEEITSYLESHFGCVIT